MRIAYIRRIKHIENLYKHEEKLASVLEAWKFRWSELHLLLDNLFTFFSCLVFYCSPPVIWFYSAKRLASWKCCDTEKIGTRPFLFWNKLTETFFAVIWAPGGSTLSRRPRAVGSDLLLSGDAPVLGQPSIWGQVEVHDGWRKLWLGAEGGRGAGELSELGEKQVAGQRTQPGTPLGP